MTEYYKLWRKEGMYWTEVGTVTSGSWLVRIAGKYKTNKYTNGWWGEPITHTVTEKDIQGDGAYIAHG